MGIQTSKPWLSRGRGSYLLKRLISSSGAGTQRPHNWMLLAFLEVLSVLPGTKGSVQPLVGFSPGCR